VNYAPPLSPIISKKPTLSPLKENDSGVTLKKRIFGFGIGSLLDTLKPEMNRFFDSHADRFFA
jgi:hypothetical protein